MMMVIMRSIASSQKRFALLLLCFLALLASSSHRHPNRPSSSLAMAIWTDFELVRPWTGGWGSKGNVSFLRIARQDINLVGPMVTDAELSNFGCSVVAIGDLDGDGVIDIAVGARKEKVNTFAQVGAVYVLFMTKKVAVRESVRISKLTNGGPDLITGDNFGSSLASYDLDGDGRQELFTGMQNDYLSGVYVLYLLANGTAWKYRLIRGPFIANVQAGTPQPPVYGGNGPPISFQSNFGFSLASIGDWDSDGVPDLLAGASFASTGVSCVYLLLMTPNGTVKDYKVILPGENGFPPISSFADFGSSIVAIGDLDGNNVTDIAVGARFMDISITSNFRAGQTFVLMLHKNFTVKDFGVINEGVQSGKGVGLPNKDNDNCGSSLAFIGDINRDDMRQTRPTDKAYGKDRGRPSVPDVVIGCPMTLNTESEGGGKFFLTFLNVAGYAADYCEMPTKDDVAANIAPKLQHLDQFGFSMAAYIDVDKNGLTEILVGAPGDSDETGAIYVMFLRRRRFHKPFVDHLGYILSISLPLGSCCLLCILGTIFFFWYFRRKPDEVELAVKAAGLERTKDRQRKKQEFGKDGKVYADEYVA